MSRIRGACPRCQAAFDVEVEPGSFFICPSCGAKLRSREPAPKPTNLGAVVARVKASDPPPAGGATNQDSDRTIRADLKAAAPATPEAGPPAAPSPPPSQTAASTEKGRTT